MQGTVFPVEGWRDTCCQPRSRREYVCPVSTRVVTGYSQGEHFSPKSCKC
jgi:hypothetical protein